MTRLSVELPPEGLPPLPCSSTVFPPASPTSPPQPSGSASSVSKHPLIVVRMWGPLFVFRGALARLGPVASERSFKELQLVTRSGTARGWGVGGSRFDFYLTQARS